MFTRPGIHSYKIFHITKRWISWELQLKMISMAKTCRVYGQQKIWINNISWILYPPWLASRKTYRNYISTWKIQHVSVHPDIRPLIMFHLEPFNDVGWLSFIQWSVASQDVTIFFYSPKRVSVIFENWETPRLKKMCGFLLVHHLRLPFGGCNSCSDILMSQEKEGEIPSGNQT